MKLGALFLASGLWLHAVTEHSYRREVEIRLLVDDPPATGESALVVASEIPTTVRIAVFGHGKDLLRLNAADMVLHMQPETDVRGSITMRPSPDQVEDHSEMALIVESVIEPREVTFVVDHLGTRTIPIDPMADLTVANSFTIVGPITLRPDSVTISGPTHLVESVQSIRTDTIHLAGLSEPVRVDVSLQQPQTDLLRLDRMSTTVLADIQELAEYPIANVPVRVEGRRGAVAAPSRVAVKVRGGADLIGSLDPETDLGLFVDAGSKEEPDTEAGYPVLSPKDRLYELLEISPSRVDIVVR